MSCPRWLVLALVLRVAAPSALGGEEAVTEREALHTWVSCPRQEQEEEPRLMPVYSACMLRCAARALSRMTGSQKVLRLHEGKQGEEQEFCWVLRLRCQEGERLTKAFVFFNLHQPPDGDRPPSYRLLLTTPPAQRRHLRPRPGNWATKLLSTEACGVHFDVTEPFRRAKGGPEAKMCVRAVCPAEGVCEAVRLALQCPPFLTTLWQSLPRPDG
ncbi:hypothetical protein JRQ81_009614 [Phrynocephalus forsythii]|uniref:Uncharacterized protein n=1 Tax=Phrynocephalus forsythii TaxID=171643 RepID=A0A9Q0XAM8_9SAUR|nr:hypothetical protein JRQ81_009614 [Phrynocephalus forsythii]